MPKDIGANPASWPQFVTQFAAGQYPSICLYERHLKSEAGHPGTRHPRAPWRGARIQRLLGCEDSGSWDSPSSAVLMLTATTRRTGSLTRRTSLHTLGPALWQEHTGPQPCSPPVGTRRTPSGTLALLSPYSERRLPNGAARPRHVVRLPLHGELFTLPADRRWSRGPPRHPHHGASRSLPHVATRPTLNRTVGKTVGPATHLRPRLGCCRPPHAAGTTPPAARATTR